MCSQRGGATDDCSEQVSRRLSHWLPNWFEDGVSSRVTRRVPRAALDPHFHVSLHHPSPLQHRQQQQQPSRPTNLRPEAQLHVSRAALGSLCTKDPVHRGHYALGTLFTGATCARDPVHRGLCTLEPLCTRDSVHWGHYSLLTMFTGYTLHWDTMH